MALKYKCGTKYISAYLYRYDMAIIKNLQTEEIVVLFSEHNFGRGKHNRTIVPGNDISKSHAVVSFVNNAWFLADQSSNGTLVKGRRINHLSTRLTTGNQIQFGQERDTIWVVLNVNPPICFLESLSENKEIIELSSYSAYPNEESPEVSFYRTPDTKWHADNGLQTIALTHGQSHFFADKEWYFYENEVLDQTLCIPDISVDTCFLFSLSMDEEAVAIKIQINDLELDLGQHAYNQVLLALARKRQADLEKGYQEAEQGWISMEKLTVILGKELLKEIDNYYVNLQIHRLRKRLMELNPFGHLLSNVIERRNGELRFEHNNFRINKENAPGNFS